MKILKGQNLKGEQFEGKEVSLRTSVINILRSRVQEVKKNFQKSNWKEGDKTKQEKVNFHTKMKQQIKRSSRNEQERINEKCMEILSTISPATYWDPNITNTYTGVISCFAPSYTQTHTQTPTKGVGMPICKNWPHSSLFQDSQKEGLHQSRQ